jgi:hypothetical protein
MMEAWMESSGIPRAGLLRESRQKHFPEETVTLREDSADMEDPEYAYIPQSDDEIPAPGLERHNRKTALLKPRRAWAAYREMLRYYGIKTLADYLIVRPEAGYAELTAAVRGGEHGSPAENGRVKEWINLGGQIVPAFRLDALRRDIREGRLGSWEEIHRRYDAMAAEYPLDTLRHAWDILGYLGETEGHPCGSPEGLKRELAFLIEMKRHIAREVYRSRAKDFLDPFRGITYRGREEMEAVVGGAEQNFFVRESRETLRRFEETAAALLDRL